jgi:hypothetical protein
MTGVQLPSANPIDRRVAQLVEHSLDKRMVTGSIPVAPTTRCVTQLAEYRPFKARVVSSTLTAPTTGRSSSWKDVALQKQRRGFESSTTRQTASGAVAQLGRAPGLQPGCRRFNSCQLHHFGTSRLVAMAPDCRSGTLETPKVRLLPRPPLLGLWRNWQRKGFLIPRFRVQLPANPPFLGLMVYWVGSSMGKSAWLKPRRRGFEPSLTHHLAVDGKSWYDLPMKCSLCKNELKTTRRRRCGSCNTKIRRFRTKLRAVMLMGGKCDCGYKLRKDYSNLAAFEFHHVGKKDFQIGNVANKSWKFIKEELKKCDMKCSNCHCIVHSSQNTPEFLKEVMNYKGDMLDFSVLG